MDIKPSGDVLKALGALPTERAAAKPRVADVRQPERARLKRADAPAKPELPRQARAYRPGTILDIFV